MRSRFDWTETKVRAFAEWREEWCGFWSATPSTPTVMSLVLRIWAARVYWEEFAMKVPRLERRMEVGDWCDMVGASGREGSGGGGKAGGAVEGRRVAVE